MNKTKSLLPLLIFPISTFPFFRVLVCAPQCTI